MPDTMKLPPVAVTNEQLYALLERVHAKLSEHDGRINDQIGETAKLRRDTDAALLDLKNQIDAVLQPWRAAKLLGIVTRWVAGVIITLAMVVGVLVAFVEWVRDWVKGA